MGSSASERIALLVETRADLSGVQAVRAETSALGRDARAASETAAAGTGKLAVSTEQMREALAASNGDLAAAAKLLADETTALEKKTIAVDKSEASIRRMALAQSAAIKMDAERTASLQRDARIAGSIGPQLGPGLPAQNVGARQLGPALPGLTTAAAAAASAASIEKVEVNARKAGNAMNIMAASAAAGQGSVAGLATAAGNVAQEMALMSKNATIAASAAGIGVLIAAIGVLIAVSIEAKKALNEIPEGKLSGAIDAHLKNLHSEAQIKAEIAQIDARRAALADNAGRGDTKALQAIVDLDAARTAALARGTEIENEARQRTLRGIGIAAEAQTTVTDRYAAQLRKIDADRAESIRTHELTETAANERAETQRRALAKSSADYVMQLGTDVASAADQVMKTEFDRRKRAEDVRFRDEERAAAAMTLSEADATAASDLRRLHHEAIVALIEKEQKLNNDAAKVSVGLGSDNLTTRYNARLTQIEAERKAAIAAGVDEVTATAAAEQKKRDLRRQTSIAAASDAKTLIDVLLASGSKQVHAVGAVGETIRRVLIGAQAAHAAVEAAIEGGKAIGSAAVGDFRGAALHGAAALELAKAAALGGQEALSPRSGAGGGGGASGGGGESGTFQPRNGGAAGDQVLVLQTIDPYSRKKINEVRYLIGRAGTLKRPIQIPSTTGLQGAA